MTRTIRFLLVAIIAMGMPFMASAVDRVVGYSGFLTNTAGSAPAADISHTVIFSIYTVASGVVPPAVWTETQSVPTVTGEFSVKLGAVPANPLNLNFENGTNYWLGIAVDGNPEFPTRKALLYVPFAFGAGMVETRAADPLTPVTGQMWLIVP